MQPFEKLNFDNIETFVYTREIKSTAEELKEIMNMNKIIPDLIVGNPPYKGQSQLHQQFFNQSVELVKAETGQVLFIQPAIAYFNKKDSTDLNSQKMRDNIIKYNTETEMIKPSVFGNAKNRNDISITNLIKNITIKYFADENNYNRRCLFNIIHNRQKTHKDIIGLEYVNEKD